MKRRGNWRLIFSEPAPGPGNMAIDEALFLLSESSGFDGTLRFYFWEPPCISLGYFQKAGEALDIVRCKELDIGITKRMTGGGAIYHHAEITYSLTAALPNPMIPSNVDESYRYLEEFIIKSLNMYGANTSYRGKADQKDKSTYCFLRPSKYDLVSGGKKLAGSAQRRSGKFFLQHGSILLDLNELEIMLSVMKPACELLPAKKEFKEKVTALEPVLGRSLDKYELCKQLAFNFEKTYSVKLIEAPLTAKETETAGSLLTKYTIT